MLDELPRRPVDPHLDVLAYVDPAAGEGGDDVLRQPAPSEQGPRAAAVGRRPVRAYDDQRVAVEDDLVGQVG
ncbi:MAG TPA: hypothetical protein VGD51_18300, partial [Nocardioidaceae bacterium]